MHAEQPSRAAGTGAAPGRGIAIKTAIRIVFGLVWIIDGALKFTSGFVDSFPGAVQNAGANAPGWLTGWYTFWMTQANSNASMIVYTVGILELVLGIALILGFARKLAYLGGFVLSLLIWAVPEGFGGPYSVGSGGTDVGTGVIYALVFVALLAFNAGYGPSRLSLDYYLERWMPAWAKIAELRTPVLAGGPATVPATTSGSG